MRTYSGGDITEIAILFKRKIKDEEPNIFELVPIDLLFGFYENNYEYFINKDGKAYTHFTDVCEDKYVFGFNKPINEYLEKFQDKDINYKETIELIKQEEIKNKKYFCDFINNDDFFVFVKDKNNKTEYRTTDIICDTTNAELHAYKMEDENLMEEKIHPQNVAKQKADDKKHIIDKNSPKIDTVKLYKTLKEHIIGQDEGLKTIVGTIWNNYNSNDGAINMIIIGPPGVGKTETSRIISEVANVPIAIVSANNFSRVGYKGDDTVNILKSLIINANGDIKKAERGIVLIDEIDKIAKNGEDKDGVSTEAVQNELLKMIEDGTYLIDGQEIKTKNITFIGLGAFEDINKEKKSLGFGNNIENKEKKYNEISFKDLEKYGMTNQLLGRLPVIVPFNNLNEEDFKNIMLNSKSSSLASIKKTYKNQGIDLIFNYEVITYIAKRAKNLNIGARGIKSIIINIMNDINFEMSQHPGEYSEIVITQEMINDCKKYILK